MAERTPPTAAIKQAWIGAHPFRTTTTVEEREVEFDRWLAEARREAAEKAWDEGFTRGFYDVLAGGDRDACETSAINPYTKKESTP